MTLKNFIKSYSEDFMTNRLFLINRGTKRTELYNPNADLIDEHLKIKSWNVQITCKDRDSIITFFIYLED